MAVSSLEEIIEQRRRQRETAQRNAQRTQTRGNPTRTKDDEYKPPPRQPTRAEKDDVYKPPVKVVVPTRQVPKDDKVTPARKPIYEPVKFAGNSQRTKDDTSQPQKYVPRPYQPPGKEKDDKVERPAITPQKYTPALIPSGQPMSVGLSTDRPDTGQVGMYQSQVAQAPTATLDTRGWKPERTKDDDAFPQPQKPMFGPQPAGGNNLAFNPGVSPGISYLANNVGTWGNAAADVVGDAGKAVTDKLDQFGAWGANATGQGDPWTALQNTPGAEYARQRDAERRADDKNAWDNTWSNVAGNVDQAFYVPGKALETTPIPGVGVSAGQVLSAGGEALNKQFNPFAPSRDLRNQTGAQDWATQNLGETGAALVSPWTSLVDGGNELYKRISGDNPNMPAENNTQDWVDQNMNPITAAFLKPFTGMFDVAATNLEKSQQVRAGFDALTPEQQEQAKIANVNIISGPDRWQTSIDALLNKDATVQSLESKAREAQAAGDMSAAASYGAQAYKLQNTSATDLVDEQTNPWAEIAGGIILDPTNILPLGVVGDAWKAYKLKKTFDIADDVGITRLTGALEKATQLLGNVAPGEKVDLRSTWQRINPLARTADTEAHMAGDTLFSTVSQLFGNVTTKTDAQNIITALINDPAQLVRGLTGMTSPNASASSVDGVYKVGAGVVANQNVIDKFPILKAAAEQLQNARALAGEGAFNPVEFIAEADNIIYQSARKMFGLDAIEAMPDGATTTRLRRLADGTGVIEYLDKGKNVIKTSTPEVFANAQETYKTLQKAVKAGGEGGAYKALRTPDRLQRAIMSDMFLGLRPAHWIRNAASATATLMSDGIYSVAPIEGRVSFWANKFGGVMPEAGLFGELENVTRGIVNQLGDTAGDQNWTRAFWPKNNPYAAAVEAGNNFWGGFTNAAGVPFGENAFRMTAFDTAGQRVFRQGWTDTVKRTYGPVLEQMGLDESTVGKVLNAVTDAGIVGDKAGVANAARAILSKNTLPFNLRDLGIPDELISLESWRKLNSYLADAMPDQIGEVVDAVRMTFADESKRFGRILNQSPTQPGVYAWTNAENAQDGADIIDTLTQTARQAGIDPQQAQAAAQQLVTGLNQTLTTAMDTFRKELAQNPQQGALNLAMDTWAQYYDLKRAARAEVDGFSKQAIATRSPQDWQKKWQETQRIWQEFGPKTQELFDSARNGLLTLGQGGDVPKRYDWYETISRYASYDDEAIRTARTAGLSAGGITDPATAKAIEANRQYLDNSVMEVFDAFRRSPTPESFDMLVSAQKKIDELSASAASYLAEKRADMLPKRVKEYQKLANQVWGQFFDSAVVHNNATQRLIIADGVAQQATSKLRWTDEFAGGEFQLIGKNADGTWQAKRLDDGSMHSFADASQTTAGAPSVPKEIANDFYRVTNDSEKIIDDVIADMKAAGAPPVQAAPQAAPLRQTGQPTQTEIAYEEFNKKLAARKEADKAAKKVAKTPPAPPKPSLEGAQWKVPTAAEQTAGRRVITREDLMAVNDKAENGLSFSATGDVSTYASEEIQKTLDAGGQAIMWNDGKRIDIVKIENGQAVDAQGQKWGFMSVATGNPNTRNEIELIARNAPVEPRRANYRVADRNMLTKAEKLEQRTVTSVGDVAKEQAGGAVEARNALRSEWDRVAVGELNLPSIDTLSMNYQRTGAVSEGTYEDLYGQVIAGNRINGQKDVENLVEEYTQLKRQADKADETVKASQQYKKKSAEQLVKEFRDELIGDGYTTDEIAKMNRRALLDWKEAREGVTPDEFGMVMYESTTPLIDTDAIDAAYRANNPYNINFDWSKKTGWDPFGLTEDDGDLYKLIGDTVRKKNPNKAPEMGNVAQHMSQELRRAERQIIDRLPEILQGTPNNLTPAQRLQAVDALNQLLPQFDNVLAKSTQAGKDAMNFAMLNFRDRRNIDTALAMVIPFHYFWTRSAMNWGKRVLQKPALLNMWYESERGIAIENQQANLPNRLQGTLPNPLASLGIGNERMGNPVNWILPFASYMGNEFNNPDEAQGEFERLYLQWKKWTPGLLPALQYAADSTFDKTQPLTDGSKRTDGYEVGDYVPIYRMAGYLKQMLTGQNLPGAGDQWDQDVTRRTLGELTTEGADALTAQYAQQISKNIESGQPPETKVPPEIYDAAYKLYIEASKSSAGDKLETQATGYFGGNSTRAYNPGEAEIRDVKEQYNTAGYDQQTNKWGSKEAKEAIKEANPALPVAWSRYDDAPGVAAQYTQAESVGDAAWAAGATAVDAMLAANPDAKGDDIYDARLGAIIAHAKTIIGADAIAGFVKANPGATPAEVVAFIKDQKYPNAKEKEFPDGLDRYKGMNPEERNKAMMNNISAGATTDAVEPVYPGADATDAEWEAYNKAKAAFAGSKRQNAVDRMTTLSGDAERGRLEVDAATAGEVYDKYQQRNMTPAEASRVNEIGQQSAMVSDGWTEYNKLEGAEKAEYLRNNPDFADYYAEKYPDNGRWWEGSSAGGRRGGGSGDFKAASAAVGAEFGAEGSAMWAEYYALDDDQRAAYKLANPEIKAMTMAGYNPEEYAQAAELFGDDAWTEWANIPPYGESDAAKAARAAYLEEHPQAKLLGAWLNGRPGNYDESAVGDDFAYNFGVDFATAQEMFGEEIWSVWAGYSSGWDKATKKAYHNQYPRLGEMMDWWYGNETQKGQGRGAYARGSNGGGRSYGNSSGGGGGRSYRGGGGSGAHGSPGYSWGGGDDSGYRPPVDLNMPYIENEGLSRELQVEAPRVQQSRKNFNADWWLKAGDRTGPEKMQPWRPQKKPY